MKKKQQKRQLVLQPLEERILWDATLQPEPPQESAPDSQEIEQAQEQAEVQAEKQADNQPASEISDDQQESNELASESNETNPLIEDSENSEITAEEETNLLSGNEENPDAVGTDASDANNITDNEDASQLAQDKENKQESRFELVIIDESVENNEALINDILAQNAQDSSRELKIVTINKDESGLEQISDALGDSDKSVGAIHIVGHGDDSQIYIGSDELSLDTLSEHQTSLQNWSDFLSADADILFYGCDVVENQQGEQLLSQISEITGADVSGSSDTTGSSNLHADWDLEFAVGEVESATLLSTSSTMTWSGVLALDAPIGGINAPDSQMIDEDPTFELCFDSPAGSDPGFGPFGDFVISNEVDVDSMTYLGAPVTFTQVGTWDGAQWLDSSSMPIATHPFDATAASPLGIPTGNAVNDVWYAIELPFGSYTEAQPKATIEVEASFNSNAQVGNPVDMSWTPGYLLGSTADGSANDAIQGTTTTDSTTPEVIQISKSSDLTENETPSGPNYPVRYTITVNVAEGETVSDVVVTDYLPANSVFLGSAATLDQTSVDVNPINGGSSSTADVTYNAGANTIEIDLGSMTGSAVDAGEIEIEYYVYFQDVVTSGGIPNTNAVNSLNESTVTGMHNGVAVTDSGDNDSVAPDGAVDDGDAQVQVQNLTTQKTPQLVTGFNPDGSPILAEFNDSAVNPGALIYWTVDVQVSDYHAFDNVVFTDQLSDGQEFLDGSSSFTLQDSSVVAAANLIPTLRVLNDSDFGGNTDDTTVGSINFDAAHVYTAGETPPATMNVADGSLTNAPGIAATGEVTTIFDISGQLRANGTDGVLVGDLNNTNDLDGDTNDAPLPGDITVPRTNGNATTVTLNFFSSIKESFDNLPGAGDVALNPGDPISNDGEIEGDVGDVDDSGVFTPEPGVTGPLIDDTSFSAEVAGVSIDKTIYAINQVEVQNPDFFDGSANPDEDTNESDEATFAGIQPGDEVTYRIRVELSSVNAENFTIRDFLPIPIYDADDDFVPSQFSNTPGSAPVLANMVAGNVQFGEDYNLDDTNLQINVAPAGSGITPGNPHPADNSYPHITLDVPNNQLLFDFGTFNENDLAGAGTDDQVVIDILLTALVRDVSIKDGSAITNQGQVAETDSSGNPIVSEDIVQVKYLAPDLMLQKGVVAISSDSAGSLTSDSVDFGVNFASTDPGTATANPANNSLNFNGNTITLANFTSDNGILNSNAEDVDGGDHVRYALTVANEGGGDAHDILVEDSLPDITSGFVIPSDSATTNTVVNSLNLQVYDGQGNRLTAGTDFTATLSSGKLEVEISKELDGRTNDSSGNEIADSDEILTDPNPGNGNADEVKNVQDGDELFIIVYDLELDNETALDSSGAHPDFTYTNEAEITEYYQTAEGDPARNNDNNIADAVDSSGNPVDDDLTGEATVSTPEIEVEKSVIDTDLDTDNNADLTQVTIGERITYEVKIKIPEGEVFHARLFDRLDRGLELDSIDSIKFLDENDNVASIATDRNDGTTTFTTEYAATPDAVTGEILNAPLDSAGGPLTYTFNDNGRSNISLELGTLINTNDDANLDEFVVITYTAMVVNDSQNVSGTNRNNQARLAYDVEDTANPGTFNEVESDFDRAPNVEIIEPELEVVKTVSVNGTASTGNANDDVNPDTAQGDTGDAVTYTIVLQHTSDSDTDAYDVTLTDNIPVEINNVVLVSAIYSGDGSDLAGTDITLAGNNISTSSDFTVELNETVTVTVTGEIAAGSDLGDFVDNTANITWTSYPDTPDGTNFVPAGQEDVERGPSTDPSVTGGESNPYSDSDPARVEISGNAIEKYLVNSEITNEADATADGQLAAVNDADGINRGAEAVIGETLTYEIVLTIAEGTTNNAVIEDTLDPGLVLVSLDSMTTRQFNTNTNSVIAGPAPNLTLENDATDLGLPASDASNAFISYTHNAGATSDELQITLGDIVNSNDDNDIQEQIVLRYTVMVSDVVANQGNDSGTTGTRLNNSAEMTFTNAASTENYTTGTDSADTVEVIEPDLEVNKSVSIDGPGDAGDEVTYTIVIQHTSDSEADAFDVSLSDTLPTDVDFSAVNFATGANISVTDSNSTLSTSDLEIAAGVLRFASTANTQVDEAGNNTVDFQLGSSPRTLNIQITGILQADVQPQDLIENDADIRYSSLDEHDDGSTNPVGDGDDEEDRSSFVPGAGEDSQRIYTDTDDADFTVPSPTITKSLTGTDVTSNGNAANQVTIGELITYTVAITLPEGEIDNASILDNLDAGLEFYDIVSVSGTTSGSNVTTDLAGGFASVAGATSGAVATGQSITFDLGNLTASGDNTGTGASATSQGDDQIIIVYRAVVKDIVANDDGDSDINNSAQFRYETDATAGTQTTATVEADGVSIVEPELEVIKQINGLADEVDASNLDAGDTVVYRITIRHTADSSTTAFDAQFRDVLPSQIDFSGVDFTTGTNVSVTDSAGTLTSNDFAINAGALEFDVGGASPTTYDIELGRSIVLEITGVINTTSTPGQTVSNQVDLNWTSLPEGHVNDGTADERGDEGFDGEGAGTNPYDDSDDIAYTTPLPTFAKNIVSSSIHGDAGSDGRPDLTIGEEVTYELVATLTEGTTPLVITDTLPPTADADGSLSFVKAEVTFIGAGVTSSGNLSLGDTDTSSGDISVAGDLITFDFGTVVLSGNNITAGNDNVIRVQVTAVVTDTAAGANHNESGDQLTNTATLNFSATPLTPGAGETITDTADVDIIEPELGIEKEFIDPSTGNAVSVVESGDTIRVRLTVENTGTANAYDVIVDDLINDQDQVFINPSVVTTPTGFTYSFTDGGGGIGVADATDRVRFAANNGVFIPPASSAPSNELVFEFDVELTDAVVGSTVFEGLRINNTANVNGDSIDGDPLLSNGNPNTEQRDTSDDDSDSVAGLPDFDKSVISTNVTDATNGVNDVTIGERIVYEINFEIPDSDFNGDNVPEAVALTVKDNLPQTLELLDATIVSIGADISAPGLSAGDSLMGGAAGITANDTNSDSINDEAVFNFGNVTVNDDDDNVDADQTIVIRIEAIVKDNPLNVKEDTTDPADDAVNDKTNVAEMTFGPVTNTDSATVEVIEPVLEIEKNFVDPTTGQPIFSAQAGDVVQIELQIENTGTAVAYNVFVEDSLNAGVIAGQYVDGSGVIVNNGGFTDNSNLAAGNNLARFDQTSLAAGATATFRINVQLAATLSLSAGDTVDNTATIEGESLPSGNPDQATESRTTSDEDKDFIFGIPSIEKEVADNYSHTGDADLLATSHVGTSSATGNNLLEDLTIGEIVTYEVTIALPDTENAGEIVLVPTSITDTLPAGLGLVDARVVAIGGNLTIGAADGGEIVTDASGPALLDGDNVAGIGSVLTTSGAASTGLAVGDSLLGGSANITGTVGGSSVVFNFGGLGTNTVVVDENSDGNFERENTAAFTDLVGTEQSIVVQVDAVVLDNAATATITNPYVNQAQLTWEQTSGSPVVISDDAEVEVVEPKLEITKSFKDPTSGVDLYTIESGDQVMVELAVTNTGNANAYDALVNDEIDLTYWQNITAKTTPAGFTYALTNGSNPTPMDTVVYTMSSDSGAGPTDPNNYIAPGEFIVFEFLMEYNGAGGAAFELTNTANVSGEALSENLVPDPQLPGGGSAGLDVDRTTEDDDSDNVYEDPSLDKAFKVGLNPDTASNQFDPLVPDLAIGEVVTYTLEVTLPESPVDSVGATIPIQVNLIDDLPDGFGLVSVEVTDIGSAISSPNLAVGDGIEILDPVALTPIVDVDPDITTADNFADPNNTQDEVTLDFGTVTVDPSSNNVANQKITVEVTAVVLDISPENDIGNTKTNEAKLEFFGTPTGNPVNPFDNTTPIEKTDTVDVEIVRVPDDPISAVLSVSPPAPPSLFTLPVAPPEQSIFDIYSYDVFDRDGNNGIDDFDDLMLQIRRDVQYELEKLPVHYMATGITEHGSNVTMLIYGEDGSLIGSRTVLADSAGNWVVTFPNLVLEETPHHVEVYVTPVSYNDSTAGEYNTRVYYTPALDSRHFHSKVVNPAQVFSERAETVMESQHQGNRNPLGDYDDDWNHPYEFLAVSNNEKL